MKKVKGKFVFLRFFIYLCIVNDIAVNMRYLLKRIENGNEVTTAEGDSLSGMRSVVKNSTGIFDEGFVIYEMKPVEWEKDTRINRGK